MLYLREGVNSREDYERVSTQLVIHPELPMRTRENMVGLLYSRQRDLGRYVDADRCNHGVRPMRPGARAAAPVISGLYAIDVPEWAVLYWFRSSTTTVAGSSLACRSAPTGPDPAGRRPCLSRQSGRPQYRCARP